MWSFNIPPVLPPVISQMLAYEKGLDKGVLVTNVYILLLSNERSLSGILVRL